ncbi:unnamed protein product, partial [Rotaria sordida]
MPMIQTISIADQQHHQFRGGLFNFFSDINQPQLTAKHGSSINTGGNTDDLNGKGTDPWLHMAKN